MAPTPVTNPERRFVLTRLDGSTETNVAISSLLPLDFTANQDQAIRQIVYQNARTLRDANPGAIYLLYGPTNGGPHTDGDKIWDSRLNGGDL